MALPITLGISCVFAITGTTIFVYSSGSGRQAYYGTSRQSAVALSEAGLNNALAVVFKPGNNPLNPYLFCSAGETLPCPPRSATVDGQTVAWTGTLDRSQSPAVWALKGTATVRNPTGPGVSPISRTMTAQVRVTAVYTEALSNPVWDYVYVYGTGDQSGCDYTQGNNSVMGLPLYVTGNACLYNSAWISGGPLHVKGTLGFNSPQNSVGTPLNPVTRDGHNLRLRLIRAQGDEPLRRRRRERTAAQSLTTYPFPSLTNVPVATPGNQPALPTAQRPQTFSG